MQAQNRDPSASEWAALNSTILTALKALADKANPAPAVPEAPQTEAPAVIESSDPT